GDAGKDESFWRAREKGAMRSVQFALDVEDSPPEQAESGDAIFRGHNIHYSRYKNTLAYFLRLPDGRLNGSGSERHNHESITKLHKGKIASIIAVDKSTTYVGWDDFCQTL